jgi:hypothetical protein
LSEVSVNGEGGASGSIGQSSHHLASVAVPFAALRLLPWVVPWPKLGIISLDFSIYSAFITQNLGATTPSAQVVSCSSVNGDFAQKLPCLGNAPIQPYAGLFAGLTIGKSSLAYLTIVPYTIGLGQVGSMPGLRTYSGWMIGAVQLNGNL